MRKQKLIFFTEYFYPAQNSTAYYLTEVIKTAGKAFAGETEVFCATGLGNANEENLPEHMTIHRLDSGEGNKNSLWARLFKFLRITWKFGIAALWHVRRWDIVFSVTNPAFMILVLAGLKKIVRFRFVLLAYDIFPENLPAAGLVAVNSMRYRWTKKYFDWAYRQADIVISIGRDMTELLCRKGVDPEKITLIPNWANHEEVIPMSKADNALIQKFNWQDKMVFLFAGNIGRLQGIDNLLEAIAKCKAENAAFLFVGDGAMYPAILKFQEEHPTIALKCTGYLPLAKQNVFLNACDVALISLKSEMFGIGIPSKSYFSMAAGKPLLFVGDAASEIGRVISDYSVGWQVAPDNAEALAKTFERICGMSQEELVAIGHQVRTVFEKEFSDVTQLKKYSIFFSSLAEYKNIKQKEL